MRELLLCWQHTRLIVLIALCGALYAALLIPFKIAVIVPGITEIRPGAALPILLSFLFGPAAAWGAAFGNTIGDFFGGTIGPGTFFGFVGNFLYGFVPYRVARTYLGNHESLFSPKGWIVFVLSIFLASGLCAILIALGIDFLRIVPFSFLVHTIFLNNFGMSLILTPLLFRVLEKRIRQMQLHYTQTQDPDQFSPPLLRGAAPPVVLLLLLSVYAVALLPSLQTQLGLAGDIRTFELVAALVLFVATLVLL